MNECDAATVDRLVAMARAAGLPETVQNEHALACVASFLEPPSRGNGRPGQPTVTNDLDVRSVDADRAPR